MKSNDVFKALLTLALVTGFFTSTPTKAVADPHGGVWDGRHHYYRDNYGYWDEHDRYRHYIMWRNHHGYWDNRGGVRVFINID